MQTLEQPITQAGAGLDANGRQPAPAPAEPKHQNVGDAERAVSLAAGSLLTVAGLKRGTLPGLLVAGVGGALAYRGVTGHCPAYEKLGVDTATPDPETQQKHIDERGIHIEQAFLINKPAEELYRYWRNFENLPNIMTHIESVKVIDDRHSQWVAKGYGVARARFHWDAEITHDEPSQLIGWKSVPGGDIEMTGQIRFSKGLGDRGTEVHVFIDYVPPGGRLGHWVAAMLGQNPRRVVREDLRNFKRIMEIGEIPTIAGQPHGTCSGRGKRDAESGWTPLFT